MNVTQLGDFAVFGFTQQPETFLKHRLPVHLGITPRTIDFGTAGHFFFHASYGDVAESEDTIALKLGSARSLTMSPISTHQLLDQKILQSHHIDADAFRGNALVACFSKIEPRFSIYQTIMALPQLYYTRLDEGILCATDPRCLFALLDQVQLNEDAIPLHFLFRLVPGPSTYFRDIWRLFPGQVLKWNDGDLSIDRVHDLRLSVNDPTFDRLNTTSIETLYEHMSGVMGAYLDEIKESGSHPGNLLSGGVDSSLVQLLIKEHLPSSCRSLSFSFAAQTPSFEFEIAYARQASQVLETQHTFLDISPQDYPDLLSRTIETLGQPNLYNESIPCNLALAEFLASNVPDVRYFFAGQGADALHGVSDARKVALFEIARQIPGSRSALELLSALLARWARSKSHGLGEIAKMLAEASNATPSKVPTIYVPTNYVAIGTTELERARRCFGDQALTKALDFRCSLEADYLNSSSTLEKIHIIDLLTAGYDPAIAVAQLFSTCHQKLIQFYLDQDVIRMTLAFKPNIRFLKRLNTKPLQKRMLARKSFKVLTKQKKGGTSFRQDLYAWMKCGPLQEMVQAIDVPGFISKADFDEMTEHPGSFLWNLLTFDIFQKRVLKSKN